MLATSNGGGTPDTNVGPCSRVLQRLPRASVLLVR